MRPRGVYILLVIEELITSQWLCHSRYRGLLACYNSLAPGGGYDMLLNHVLCRSKSTLPCRLHISVSITYLGVAHVHISPKKSPPSTRERAWVIFHTRVKVSNSTHMPQLVLLVTNILKNSGLQTPTNSSQQGFCLPSLVTIKALPGW